MLGTESRSSARVNALTNELFLPPVHIKQKREKEKKEKVFLEEEIGGGGSLHIYSTVIGSKTLVDAWNQTAELYMQWAVVGPTAAPPANRG